MTTYKSPEEIAQEIFLNLEVSSLAEILKTKTADDMVQYHHSMGRWIRNHFMLWADDNPYTKPDCLPNNEGFIDDPMHPDEVSHKILMRVWELVHNKS